MTGGPDDLIERYFEGDRELFELYLASCRAQFRLDVQVGDAASAAGDAAALQRLAHSLKTVLQSLGEAAAAQLAHQIELQAGAGAMPAAQADWLGLRAALLRHAGRD